MSATSSAATRRGRRIAGLTWSLLHGISMLTIGSDFSNVGIREDPQAFAERSLRSLLFAANRPNG